MPGKSEFKPVHKMLGFHLKCALGVSGVFGIDPSYWLVLKPMLLLGLIWEPKIYKNESKQW
jgi:hypothetical protein